jgi:SAM-dependent methyltransferase
MKAPEYQRHYDLEKDYWWFVGLRKMVTNLLEKEIKNNKIGKMLDVGCGTGALMDDMKDSAQELWGVDISEQAISFCKQRGHTNLIQVDATEIPFSDNEFDTISAIGIIEHIDDDKGFVKELARVTKVNGTLIIVSSSFQFLWSMHDIANEHIRRYYLRDLDRIMKDQGFKKIRSSHFNFFLFPIIAPTLIMHKIIFGLKSEKAQRILPIPAKPVNFILKMTLILEAQILKYVSFPFGISTIGKYKKIS